PGSAHFWEVDTGKPAGAPLRYRGRGEALAFSPDGKTVLTASCHEHLERYEVRLWDVEAREPLGPVLRLDDYLAAVTFRPDGKLSLTATPPPSGGGWAVRLWEPGPGLALGATPADNYLQYLLAAVFRPDGKVFATPVFENAVRLWDADTGRPAG